MFWVRFGWVGHMLVGVGSDCFSWVGIWLVVCAAGLDSSWSGLDWMVLVQVPGSSWVGLGWFVLA